MSDETKRIAARLILKKQREKLVRHQTHKSLIHRVGQSYLSEYGLIDIGYSAEERSFFISHEEKTANFHLIGMPGEGKSMLQQLLMRADIDRILDEKGAPGFCLIDGSDAGDTAKKMLKYCCQEGLKKVVVIDAEDIFKKELVPCINPFERLPGYQAENLLADTIQSSWGQDWNKNPNIRMYTTALANILYHTKYTLADVQWFMNDQDKRYEARRNVILGTRIDDKPALNSLDLPIVDVQNAYKTYYRFRDFHSTVNKLRYFALDKLQLLTGYSTGWNFEYLIRNGYIIICSLPSGIWSKEQQTLLGTLIINLLIYHKDALWMSRRYDKPLYIYIDEVQKFATPKLTEVIDEKRKVNTWICAAHQRWDRIKDPDLAAALYSCPNYAIFNCENYDDRYKMVKKMFGGDITHEQAAFALKDTPKQTAWINIGKRPARKVDIRELDEPDVTDEELEEYKKEVIYNPSINPHYQPLAKVRENIQTRFANSKQSPGGRAGQHNNNTAQGNKHELRPDGDTGVKTGPVSPRRPAPRSVPAEPESASVQPTLVHKRRKSSSAERRQTMEEDQTEE